MKKLKDWNPQPNDEFELPVGQGASTFKIRSKSNLCGTDGWYVYKFCENMYTPDFFADFMLCRPCTFTIGQRPPGHYTTWRGKYSILDFKLTIYINRTIQVKWAPEDYRRSCTHFHCDWKEEYYGQKCAGCGLFYAHGQGPWLPTLDLP